jgi:hypothetical protein
MEKMAGAEETAAWMEADEPRIGVGLPAVLRAFEMGAIR